MIDMTEIERDRLSSADKFVEAIVDQDVDYVAGDIAFASDYATRLADVRTEAIESGGISPDKATDLQRAVANRVRSIRAAALREIIERHRAVLSAEEALQNSLEKSYGALMSEQVVALGTELVILEIEFDELAIIRCEPIKAYGY